MRRHEIVDNKYNLKTLFEKCSFLYFTFINNNYISVADTLHMDSIVHFMRASRTVVH